MTSRECNCHCHQPQYCVECNQPNGPLEDEDQLRAAYARVWNRLTDKIPELSVVKRIDE
jgi:hypothetical protein